MAKPLIEAEGTRYNKWTVLSVVHGTRGQKILCRCDCGVEKVVDAITVRNGRSQSCGCSRKEPKNVPVNEPKDPIDTQSVAELSLISEGYLPSADALVVKGGPAWTLESIAAIFDLKQDYLVAKLKAAGPRFGEGARQKEAPVQGMAVRERSRRAVL